MSVLIVGSVALDDIKTPYGEKKDILGGSASHAGSIASYFGKVGVVGIIGEDFPKKYLNYFKKKGIDTQGIHVVEGGKTFHWSGFYENDMNEAHTLDTQLNVFEQFQPEIPQAYKDYKYILLGNITPELQLEVLDQVKNPEMKLLDTMNFWIQGKLDELLKVFKRVDLVCINDGEAKMLTEEENLIRAGQQILKMGPKYVIIKKGEHGSMLISKDDTFVAPAYPLRTVKDPTGAGDSFAGGFLGYLSQKKKVNKSTLRSGIVAGTVMASFCCEGFGVEKSSKLKKEQILGRFQEIYEITKYGKINIRL